MNDIAIQKTAGEGRILEFATVGRDQIHFWAFTKEEKLEYYDVFLKPDEDEENDVPEISSCDYLSYQDNNFLMCGTSKGELAII